MKVMAAGLALHKILSSISIIDVGKHSVSRRIGELNRVKRSTSMIESRGGEPMLIWDFGINVCLGDGGRGQVEGETGLFDPSASSFL